MVRLPRAAPPHPPPPADDVGRIARAALNALRGDGDAAALRALSPSADPQTVLAALSALRRSDVAVNDALMTALMALFSHVDVSVRREAAVPPPR
jgi:hypothetical protein